MRELRLAVSAKVLVAEAARNLIVPVKAADHQHLFEELGRLGQGVERPGVHPARHQVIAGALRRGLRQHGGLQLDEIMFPKVAPGVGVDLAPGPQVLLHLLPPQVQIAVGQAEVLVHLIRLVPHLKGKGQRRGQDQEVARHDLDISSLQGGVLRSLRADPKPTLHRDAVLAPQVPGLFMDISRLRVEDHLDGAGVVPYLDEDDPAQVAARAYPAVGPDFLPGVLRPELPAQ